MGGGLASVRLDVPVDRSWCDAGGGWVGKVEGV